METDSLYALALIALLGIGAQWLAWRIRLPAIVLLMVAGIVAGPVLGWLHPARDFGPLLDPIIKLAVAIILFEGGLSLRFHEFRQAAQGMTRLITLGVVIAFGLGSSAAYYVGGLSLPVALVFGAIMVVTGPTVIIPLLRQARLRRRPAAFLKWEGIISDPIGALLAVVIFEYYVIAGADQFAPMAGHVAVGLLAAAGLGVGVGYALGMLFRAGGAPEYLKGPIALAAAVGVYVAANALLSESGLAATTLLGITLGNMRLPGIDEMRRFKENIALILVSAVFLLLTAELDPAILLALDVRSVALLAAVVLIIRPLTIGLATIGAGMSWQERALLGWIAPRGIVAAAVAAVFGPALTAHGYAGAERLLPLVFALILITVLAHGFSIGWLARRLGLSAAATRGVLIVGASPWTTELARTLKALDVPVMIVDGVWRRLREARLAGIPVHYGDLLSEASEEHLEFNDYGLLFAATENNAYNSHVCSHFATELGRNHVLQLAAHADDEPEAQRLPRARRGLVAIDAALDYDRLLAEWRRDYTFQRTRLTEKYDYDAFRADASPDARVILAVRADGQLLFHSPERPFKPRAGDTLVWFGPKARDRNPRAEAR